MQGAMFYTGPEIEQLLSPETLKALSDEFTILAHLDQESCDDFPVALVRVYLPEAFVDPAEIQEALMVERRWESDGYPAGRYSDLQLHEAHRYRAHVWSDSLISLEVFYGNNNSYLDARNALKGNDVFSPGYMCTGEHFLLLNFVPERFQQERNREIEAKLEKANQSWARFASRV